MIPPLRARVERGRLVLDEPTSLPDGTIVELIEASSAVEADDEDRRRLNDAIARGAEAAATGDTVSASELLRSMRALRQP